MAAVSEWRMERREERTVEVEALGLIRLQRMLWHPDARMDDVIICTYPSTLKFLTIQKRSM